jgi:hypothetical protein
MDDSLCQRFFQLPASPAQRQYEALRAVFFDGLSQKDAALHFGYSYEAFRQLVHQFRHACTANTPPPFSPATVAGDPPTRLDPRPPDPTLPTRPTLVS